MNKKGIESLDSMPCDNCSGSQTVECSKECAESHKGELACITVCDGGDNSNTCIITKVIAPLSKLQEMIASGSASQNIQIALSGQVTAKGRNLVYVFGKEDFKIDVCG